MWKAGVMTFMKRMAAPFLPTIPPVDPDVGMWRENTGGCPGVWKAVDKSAALHCVSTPDVDIIVPSGSAAPSRPSR